MTRGNPQIFWISAPLVVAICAPSADSWCLPLPKPRWSHAWSSGEPTDILRACPEDSQALESRWTKLYFQYMHTLIWAWSILATHLQSTFFRQCSKDHDCTFFPSHWRVNHKKFTNLKSSPYSSMFLPDLLEPQYYAEVLQVLLHDFWMLPSSNFAGMNLEPHGKND